MFNKAILIWINSWNQSIRKKQKYYYVPYNFVTFHLAKLFFLEGFILGYCCIAKKLKIYPKNFSNPFFLKSHFSSVKYFSNSYLTINKFSYYLSRYGIVSGFFLLKKKEGGRKLFSRIY